MLRENEMRVLVLFAAAMSLAGCEAFSSQANVFDMPVARAYQKLMAVSIKPSGKGPFYRLEIEALGKRNETVEWVIKGRPTESICVASLKSKDAEQTRIDISCRDRGGAEGGLLAKMIRNRVIELVDATLKDRPFDPQKAELGATAATWPADVIDHGNLGTAAAKALQMERETAELIRQTSPRSGSSRY
jgi:hypothetical protein